MPGESSLTWLELRSKIRDECERAWGADEASGSLPPLEETADLWLAVLEAPCDQPELRGLSELLLCALRGCLVSRGGHWSNSLGDLCIKLEPFLWKLLYLADRAGYDEQRRKQRHDGRTASLYHLLLRLDVTTRSVLAADSAESLRGQPGFAESIGHVYLARNDHAHWAKLLSDAERANAFIDVMLIYLVATSKQAPRLRGAAGVSAAVSAAQGALATGGAGRLGVGLVGAGALYGDGRGAGGLPSDGRGAVYVVHRYTLSQMTGLIGRVPELELLSDWIRGGRDSVFALVGIGGMGKSALTWKWFNDVAPTVMRPLAGRMWWSFYAPDATFENFVAHALAYATGASLEQVRQQSFSEQTRDLWDALDKRPFLLVLDGMERLLIAYGGMDAAYQADVEAERTAEGGGEDARADRGGDSPGGGGGGALEPAQLSSGEHKLRKTADLRAGEFLRELAQVGQSRILLSTRMYPADLEVAGEELTGCRQHKLTGLNDDDAFALWQALKVKGTKQPIVDFSNRCGNHPLLIRILASEVAAFRRAPRDFDAWRRAHPDFNPFAMNLLQVRSHVLKIALANLTPEERQTLQMLATFRAPIQWPLLVDLLEKYRSWEDETELSDSLTVLEDRGLIGWDRSENSYELHPVVRGVTWAQLDQRGKEEILAKKIACLEPRVAEIARGQVERFEELMTPAAELFLAQAELRQLDRAWETFREYLDDALYFRWAVARYRLELIEQFPRDRGGNAAPRGAPRAAPVGAGDGGGAVVDQSPYESLILHALGKGMLAVGRPGSAVDCFEECQQRVGRLAPQFPPIRTRIIGKDSTVDSPATLNRLVQLELAHAYRLSGRLRAGEQVASAALAVSRAESDRYQQGLALYRLGLVQSARGAADEAAAAFAASLDVWREFNQADDSSAIAQTQASAGRTKFFDLEGFVHLCLAQQALWQRDLEGARAELAAAAPLLAVDGFANNQIHLLRLTGQLALELGEENSAEQTLQEAAKKARGCGRVEEELQALTSLAERRVARGELDDARGLLAEVWEQAERGPYPLFHTDACLVLSRLETAARHTDEAALAAKRAFELAWCDGPPHAYHWGLERARARLRELNAPEPR